VWPLKRVGHTVWPLKRVGHTAWCIKIRTWCYTPTRWSPNCLCQSSINSYWGTLSTDRKRSISNCVLARKFPPIHIWQTNHHRVGPQAIREHSKEAST
jgi:hypothetical protein